MSDLMHIRTKKYNQKIINSKTHLHELKIANIKVEVFWMNSPVEQIYIDVTNISVPELKLLFCCGDVYFRN